MAKVGIRELKAHLSKYLARVRNGESVLITDRGVQIAALVPAGTEAREDEWAWGLVRDKRASWDGGKPTGLKHKVPVRGKPASKMIQEDREDRF